MIDSMSDSYDEKGEFDADSFYDEIVGIQKLMGLWAVTALLAGYAGSFMITKVSFSCGNSYRQAYIRCLLNKKQGWFDSQNSYEIPSKLYTETLKIEDAAGKKLNVLSHIGASWFLALTLALMAYT